MKKKLLIILAKVILCLLGSMLVFGFFRQIVVPRLTSLKSDFKYVVNLRPVVSDR